MNNSIKEGMGLGRKECHNLKMRSEGIYERNERPPNVEDNKGNQSVNDTEAHP